MAIILKIRGGFYEERWTFNYLVVRAFDCGHFLFNFWLSSNYGDRLIYLFSASRAKNQKLVEETTMAMRDKFNGLIIGGGAILFVCIGMLAFLKMVSQVAKQKFDWFAAIAALSVVLFIIALYFLFEWYQQRKQNPRK